MTDTENGGGLSRRDMLKRSAVVGGAVLWTTPVVQSLASPAFAAGTQCAFYLIYQNSSGACVTVGFASVDDACCTCADTNNDPFSCLITGECGPVNITPIGPTPTPCPTTV